MNNIKAADWDSGTHRTHFIWNFFTARRHTVAFRWDPNALAFQIDWLFSSVLFKRQQHLPARFSMFTLIWKSAQQMLSIALFDFAFPPSCFTLSLIAHTDFHFFPNLFLVISLCFDKFLLKTSSKIYILNWLANGSAKHTRCIRQPCFFIGIGVKQ